MALPPLADILDDLAFFDDWEERYKYIIDLGRELPPMPDALHTPERLVKGCQSNVWIEPVLENGQLHFLADSDAVIVRGLVALILAAYSGKTPAGILTYDIDGYFAALDLERHLSPTRGNGLRAMIGRIRAMAEAASH